MCTITIERIHKTVSIEAATVEIEERGVRLRLTVVDTPGYGDAMNSTDWYVKLIEPKMYTVQTCVLVELEDKSGNSFLRHMPTVYVEVDF